MDEDRVDELLAEFFRPITADEIKDQLKGTSVETNEPNETNIERVEGDVNVEQQDDSGQQDESQEQQDEEQQSDDG